MKLYIQTLKYNANTTMLPSNWKPRIPGSTFFYFLVPVPKIVIDSDMFRFQFQVIPGILGNAGIGEP